MATLRVEQLEDRVTPNGSFTFHFARGQDGARVVQPFGTEPLQYGDKLTLVIRLEAYDQGAQSIELGDATIVRPTFGIEPETVRSPTGTLVMNPHYLTGVVRNYNHSYVFQHVVTLADLDPKYAHSFNNLVAYWIASEHESYDVSAFVVGYVNDVKVNKLSNGERAAVFKAIAFLEARGQAYLGALGTGPNAPRGLSGVRFRTEPGAVIGEMGLGVSLRYTLDTATGAFAWALKKPSQALREALLDPPDPNFSTVAEPDVRAFRLEPPADQPQAGAYVAALNALLANEAQVDAVARAYRVANDRASGARAAGDTAATALQSAAIDRFAARLADLHDAQVPLRERVADLVRALDLDDPVTAADVAAFQADVRANGLPPKVAELFQLLGSDPTEIETIRARVVGVAPDDTVRSVAAAFADPTIAALLRGAATAFRTAGLGHTFAVGADSGGGPVVTVYDGNGTARSSVTAFDPAFKGGVRTATADFTGDGVPDIVVGTGPGAPTRVRVLDGVDMHELFSVAPFEASFTGGVYVAAGDVTGDGVPDLVVTPDEGGGPRVLLYRGGDFARVGSFFGIDDLSFRGGARAALGDVNGDGVQDLVIAAGFGGGPRVAVFDGMTLTGTPTRLMNDFFAFPGTDAVNLRNGVFVAAGDVTGDGRADLIFGGGPGGGPRVIVYNSLARLLGDPDPVVANFFAGDPNNRGGARVAAKVLDGDGMAHLVVGSGSGAGSRTTVYTARQAVLGGAAADLTFDAFPGFRGGVFVG